MGHINIEQQIAQEQHISPESGPSSTSPVQSHGFVSHIPPTDVGSTVRQRRRRTSPQDQAILEAAYQQNSKPDRSERADLADQVSLGEKELQIWFQNRRQNDRRRSRPLLPHELVPHLRETLLHQARDEDDETNPAENTEKYGVGAPVSATSTPAEILTSESNEIAAELSKDQDIGSLIPELHVMPPSGSERVETPNAHSLQANDQAHHHSTSGSTGRKRRFSESVAKQSLGKNINLPPQAISSTVRLSMTADGAMKVMTRLQDSPSPPKHRQPPPRPLSRVSGLQRSKSAVDGIMSTRLTSDARPTSNLTKAKFGRSRDARTWEFYCDSDARDSLAVHAEKERNGSAAGAIALIRSQSQKSKQQPLTKTGQARHSRFNIVPPPAKKPTFSRVRSSMARLGGSDGCEDCNELQGGKKGRPTVLIRTPSGDSDKENWVPGTRTAAHPLRRPQPTVHRDHTVEDPAAPAATAHNPNELESIAIQISPMNNGKDCSHDSERLSHIGQRGEDLDCIQGLLSLSQGAWK